MIRAMIGLGSNIDSPHQQLNSALQAIQQLPDATLQQYSQIYITKPWGDVIDQPNFWNAVIAIDTTLPALDLLHALLAIEHQHNRKRIQKNGPRTLDCDLLLYGDDIIDHPDLKVPHPRMKERTFVLAPLAEIASELILPSGEKISDLLAQCDRTSIIKNIPFKT